MPPAAAEKLRLRKELEKYYPFATSLTRNELASGKWFADWFEKTLGAYSSVPAPAEVQARIPDRKDPDALAAALTSAAVHEAIAIADAYEEDLSGTEVRNLKEKRPARPEEKLTGDAVALVAELCATLQIDVKLLFDLAAAYGKMLNAGETDLILDVLARSLGAFDVEEAKASGKFAERIGAKIFDRAIVQTIGSDYGEAQRKGFYCYYAKAISKEAKKLAETLPAYEAPPKADLTGPMAAAVDDGTSFAT
jgi:hypothetical protein